MVKPGNLCDILHMCDMHDNKQGAILGRYQEDMYVSY